MVWLLIAVPAFAVAFWLAGDWVKTYVGNRRRKQTWKFVACPLADNAEEAVDWFYKRGARDIKLWRGDDNLVRGTGKVRE